MEFTCFCAQGLCGKILILHWNKLKQTDIVLTSHSIFTIHPTQLTFLWHLTHCGPVFSLYIFHKSLIQSTVTFF
jgi:hypothetical protein